MVNLEKIHNRCARSIQRNEDEKLIMRRRVEFRELKDEVEDEKDRDNMIRVWGGSSYVALQLRAKGPVTDGGKDRHFIATASYLDKKELKALIEVLQFHEKNLIGD